MQFIGFLSGFNLKRGHSATFVLIIIKKEGIPIVFNKNYMKNVKIL